MIRIAVTSVAKKYKIYPHRWGRLLEWASGDRYIAHRPEWALRDITFEIRDGECVGIIGMNGAGKSTLLKILAGTTQPTEGSLRVTGSVAAVLELGLGMHPEFTGRQNAILACQLMGMERAAIDQCLPSIQSFSELGDFLERPVRTYSTGMQVRLAFSAATALRPDVLIVDEALAVGDLYFQHKCIHRIRTFKEQGTTLLFVTHDAAALKALCERAILLDKGTLLRDGPVESVFNYYHALIAQKEKDTDIVQSEAVTRSGSREAEIVSIELTGAAGTPQRLFRVGETATLVYRIKINSAMPTPTVGFLIRDRLGADVFGTNTYHLGVPSQACTPNDYLAATFEIELNVGCGTYSISVNLHRGPVHLAGNYDWWDQALVFEVVSDGRASFIGAAALPTRVALHAVRETDAPAD
jgi:lipopolysaccharide transport system ATP-binding protein